MHSNGTCVACHAVLLIAASMMLGCDGHSTSEPVVAQQSATQTVPTEPPSSLASFSAVPYLWAQDPARFAGLWSRAHSETVRVAVLGDSQETSPGGAGYIYLPRLNYEAWRRFGNVPETQVVGYGSFGGGSPWGEWLVSGAAANPGASTTRIHSTRRLPGISPAAHSSLAGNLNINGQWHGQLTILRQDGINVAPVAQLYSGIDYMCTQEGIRAEVFAATHAYSGEVQYVTRPLDDTARGDYFAPITSQGVLTMGLATGTFEIKSAITPVLEFHQHPYLQFELSGTDDHALTDIVGVRLISNACSHGLVFQDFASGGYTVESFLTYNSDAGSMFRAFGFHAAILHLGANDAGRGVTATMHLEQTEQLIAMLRIWVGDPAFPVVLMTDPFRTGWNAEAARQFDHYAGAHLAIARKDANVLVINSRRLMDDIGWSEARPDRLATFLNDGVHYTARGAIDLAAAEAAALFGY